MKSGVRIVLSFGIGLLIAFTLKIFIVDILYVSGDSMQPTISSGSFIAINKLQFGVVKPFGNELLIQWHEPERGDIVMYPYNNKWVIKRCVATAGDRLVFSTDSGYTLLIEPTDNADSTFTVDLTESQYQRLKHARTVPENMIFVLGDNRAVSVDSREYGFVSTKNILAKKW